MLWNTILTGSTTLLSPKMVEHVSCQSLVYKISHTAWLMYVHDMLQHTWSVLMVCPLYVFVMLVNRSFAHLSFVVFLVVMSASSDTSLKIWNLPRGACTSTLKPHKDYVQCLAYSSGTNNVVSGGLDHNLFLWDINSLTQLTASKNTVTS